MRRTGGPADRGTGRGRRWLLAQVGAGTLLLSALVLLSTPSALSAQEVKTIKPGMSQAEVEAQWGKPLAVRSIGAMTYLYYKNDCLKRCGTHDVVFLEHGQVIDAVVRDKARGYDGIASSPKERGQGTGQQTQHQQRP